MDYLVGLPLVIAPSNHARHCERTLRSNLSEAIPCSRLLRGKNAPRNDEKKVSAMTNGLPSLRGTKRRSNLSLYESLDCFSLKYRLRNDDWIAVIARRHDEANSRYRLLRGKTPLAMTNKQTRGFGTTTQSYAIDCFGENAPLAMTVRNEHHCEEGRRSNLLCRKTVINETRRIRLHTYK